MTAWAWLPEGSPVDVGLPVVEVADIPTGLAWRLARETATVKVYDDRVEQRVSKELARQGVCEAAFWRELARRWAVRVHAGDVLRARRSGLGRNPPQQMLRDVSYPPYDQVRAAVQVPRLDDVMMRRSQQEDGR